MCFHHPYERKKEVYPSKLWALLRMFRIKKAFLIFYSHFDAFSFHFNSLLIEDENEATFSSCIVKCLHKKLFYNCFKLSRGSLLFSSRITQIMFIFCKQFYTYLFRLALFFLQGMEFFYNFHHHPLAKFKIFLLKKFFISAS